MYCPKNPWCNCSSRTDYFASSSENILTAETLMAAYFFLFLAVNRQLLTPVVSYQGANEFMKFMGRLTFWFMTPMSRLIMVMLAVMTLIA
jgi:hypothetical protein